MVMFQLEIESGLALKPLELSDADALFRMIDQSREHLREYLAFVDLTESADDTRAFVKETVQANAEQKSFVVVILVGDEVAGLTGRSEEHTSELQSRGHLVCRLLLEKK